MELYVQRSESKGELPDVQEEIFWLRSRERRCEGQAGTTLWVAFKAMVRIVDCLSVDIRKSLRGIKQMLNRSETNHIRNSGGRDWNGSTENEN